MSDPEPTPVHPSQAASDGYRFEISGGHPALDFANTVSRRKVPEDNQERLTHFGRLVSWSVQAGLIAAKEGDRLRAEAGARPRAAATALRRAIGLREALFALFVAVARGERAPSEALAALNAALPEALATLRVGPGDDGFRWSFSHEQSDLAPMLAPIVRSAADLLTSADLARVRECGAESCFWLFLDHSKSGTRRWCDMKVCGNRAKARRHYQRGKNAPKRSRTSG